MTRPRLFLNVGTRDLLSAAISRTKHGAALLLGLSDKSFLNFRVDFVEPLFSAVAFLLIKPNLSL
jgi:hypothetical protein